MSAHTRSRRDFLQQSLKGLSLATLGTHWLNAHASQAKSAAPQEGYAVLNPYTQQLILGMNADKKRHPASLTKMMSALLIFEAINSPYTSITLNSMVPIPHLVNTIAEDIFSFRVMQAGETYPVQKLLAAMGNRSDAFSTMALAVYLGTATPYTASADEQEKLKYFIARMNEKAQEIGMTNSYFSVVAGEPHDNHYSTPSDMAKLVCYIHERYPDLAKLTFGQAHYNLAPFSDETKHTSSFLRNNTKQVLWAKTGITNSAGYCLATYCIKDGMPLAGVVMGEKDNIARNERMGTILNLAYRQLYRLQNFLRKN